MASGNSSIGNSFFLHNVELTVAAATIAVNVPLFSQLASQSQTDRPADFWYFLYSLLVAFSAAFHSFSSVSLTVKTVIYLKFKSLVNCGGQTNRDYRAKAVLNYPIENRLAAC